MTPPLISYSTFHRMGLTFRNLNSLLKTTDDFELHIIDSNSQDDTWEYIQSLNDSRIKSRTRFPINLGPIYPINLNLTRRRPDQYFIVLESDVYLYASDWISRFMKVFETFPEVGLLGVPRPIPLPGYEPEVVTIEKDGVSYNQLKHYEVGSIRDFVPGHCQCLRPELIDTIGYWCEENCYGDAEISIRINKYTSFKAGLTTNIPIDLTQTIPCENCEGIHLCKLNRDVNTCFDLRNNKHKNLDFSTINRWKYFEYFDELNQGKRSVYCASLLDPMSYSTHLYHIDWALENFNYYAENAN
ncbi:glycosyltransferase family A protein [Anaerocolumna sp. MB42-C2]|uniref:glycosyltransferase family A protein n=1 Tax=Anaerocolumna sp. MB42-C2 TaxID=3070997 RepID=UPI0027E1E79D|nr:glycosyltransferase family A protein [Anaerocolumna sp. MB42-C2]WMJ87115.1 glycosyltransferase family A protein [Anaerocolumna sp. MB42-C2]